MKNIFLRLTVAFALLSLLACDDSTSAKADESSSSRKAQSSSSHVEKSSSSNTNEVESSSSVSGPALCKTENEDNCEYGEIIDDRDCQIYKTVKIGHQRWMAENLNYKISNSRCYNDSAEYCKKYGSLYDGWGLSELCPSGWHIPSRDEWNELVNLVGGEPEAGIILKTKEGWNTTEIPVDGLGFSARPAGYCSSKECDYEGKETYFWSTTEWWHDSSMRHSGWSTNFLEGFKLNKYGAYTTTIGRYTWNSVRCVQDSIEKEPLFHDREQCIEERFCTDSVATPCKTADTDTCKYGKIVDEVTGKIFKTVKIGCQMWMAENVNKEPSRKLLGGIYCYNDSVSNCDQYGTLHTFHSALCPSGSGYHLPDDTDFETLFRTVGGYSVAGKMLKSTSGWKDGANGIDAFGFSLLPSGVLSDDYGGIGERAYFWSGPEDSYSYNYYFIFSSDDSVLKYTSRDTDGMAVRCMKNLPWYDDLFEP